MARVKVNGQDAGGLQFRPDRAERVGRDSEGFHGRVGHLHDAQAGVAHVEQVGRARHDAVGQQFVFHLRADDCGGHVALRRGEFDGQPVVVAGRHAYLVAQASQEFLVADHAAANFTGIRPSASVVATDR